MPRNGERNIRTGSGKANQNSVDANSFTKDLSAGTTKSTVSSSIQASSVSTTGTGGLYNHHSVQGNLDELSSLIPPRPPALGEYLTGLGTKSTLSGVPDWGHLKLADGGFLESGVVASPDPEDFNLDFEVYPYYNFPPEVATGNPPFSISGNDPSTDLVFNLDPAATTDPTYTGGGPGLAHAGGFTRPQIAGSPIIETTRLMPSAGGSFRPIVVSGALYPADRGVVALMHWPAGGDVADFLAQPLTTRVLAAIVLGQGVEDSCDGSPGGIFTEGAEVTSYPGRASGQYSLRELHTGLVNGTGAALPAPFNTADPSAGQVRLGQDASAGVPIVPGGIPIFGATTESRGRDGLPCGGNDNNFFAYRLPYLSNYSSTSDGFGGFTGLPFTPDDEKFRYFEKPPVSLDAAEDLTQAGNYPNFTANYWEFQLARYRHRFSFLSNAPAPPAVIEQGSFLLLHFRTETDFEKFARDGIMPDDATEGYELLSAGLSDYSNPESTDNLTDNTDPLNPVTAPGYHVLRAAIYEDPEGDSSITITAATYSYAAIQDEVMSVSGVQYFVPGSVANKWEIDNLTLNVDDIWTNSYRLGHDASSSTQVTPGLETDDPLFIFFGMYASEEGNLIPPAASASFQGRQDQGPGGAIMEFRYDELDFASAHGAFSLTNGPLPADSADLLITPVDPMTFAGDQTYPHFSTNARLRAFVKKPIGHGSTASAVREVLFPRPANVSVLFHSTSQNPTDSLGAYGNYLSAGVARATLQTERKDYEERFLDEVYRWSLDGLNSGALDPSWDGTRGNLSGPGLPFGLNGFQDVIVRVGGDAIWQPLSFLQNDLHLENLATSPDVEDEAQVAGLPDRGPPLTEGLLSPVPSRGILLYPQANYTVGFRPAVASGDITNPQFNYSGVADPYREYVRCFDAGFSRSSEPISLDISGTYFFRIRVYGLTLSDYQYSAPGPGSAEIAIFVKIPGLTTWMDLGRPDGSGPQKQDPMVDGAGCKVVGLLTTDGIDPEHGIVFSDTFVNVGPVASLQMNSSGEVPVLVKVRVKQAGSSLNWTQGGPTGPADALRGLVGLEILRPE